MSKGLSKFLVFLKEYHLEEVRRQDQLIPLNFDMFFSYRCFCWIKRVGRYNSSRIFSKDDFFIGNHFMSVDGKEIQKKDKKCNFKAMEFQFYFRQSQPCKYFISFPLLELKIRSPSAIHFGLCLLLIEIQQG